jgi:hypothetical protein
MLMVRITSSHSDSILLIESLKDELASFGPSETTNQGSRKKHNSRRPNKLRISGSGRGEPQAFERSQDQSRENRRTLRDPRIREERTAGPREIPGSGQGEPQDLERSQDQSRENRRTSRDPRIRAGRTAGPREIPGSE